MASESARVEGGLPAGFSLVTLNSQSRALRGRPGVGQELGQADVDGLLAGVKGAVFVGVHPSDEGEERAPGGGICAEGRAELRGRAQA